jgi:hypothetical protein
MREVIACTKSFGVERIGIEPTTSCLQSKSRGRGASVQDMSTPSNLADNCSAYVARDGTLASVGVYNQVSWDRHSAVMDYDGAELERRIIHSANDNRQLVAK